MRDDIHKDAPVSPPWKTLARFACGSRAKWEDGGTRAAAAAMTKELDQIRDPLIGQIAKLIESSELRGNLLGLTSRLPKGGTDIERCLVDCLEVSIWQQRKLDLPELMNQALQERIAKNHRELLCHALTKDPRGSGEFGRRLNNGLNGISIQSIVHQRIKRVGQAVDFLDVDLSK